MNVRRLLRLFFISALATTLIGGDELAEECKKLKDNPALKDPALEKKCIDIADFRPNAANNLANQVVILPNKKTQSEIVVNLVATDQTASPIDTLTRSDISATTQDDENGIVES